MNLRDFQVPNQVIEGIVSGLENRDYFVEDFLPATPGPHKGTIRTLSSLSHFGSPHDSARRGMGQTVYRGTGLAFSGVDYACLPYDFEQSIDRLQISRVEEYVPIFKMYAAAVKHKLKTDREVDAAAVISATPWRYTDTPGAGDRWNADGSKPVAQLRVAIDALIGCTPNIMLFGYDAWSEFSQNSSVLEAMNTSADHALADPTWFKQAVGSKLGISKVVVVGSSYSTSGNPEPDDASDLTRVFAGKVWIGQMSNVPGVAAGRELVMESTALARIVEDEFQIEEYYEPQSRSRVVQGHMSEAVVAVDPRLGALLSAVNG